MEDRKNMKLEDRVALAMAYHDRGFNCAQAVACAYCKMCIRDRLFIV